jgi:hypothetical protein
LEKNIHSNEDLNKVNWQIHDKPTIKKRMKQAEEVQDKLSERGVVAFNYLESEREIWDDASTNPL